MVSPKADGVDRREVWGPHRDLFYRPLREGRGADQSGGKARGLVHQRVVGTTHPARPIFLGPGGVDPLAGQQRSMAYCQ